MTDLITPSRAAQNPSLAALAQSNPAYLDSLITAASDAIRRACGRDFSLGSYSEFQSGGIYIRQPLRLGQFPVVEITRIAAHPLPALLVQNVDTVTNQRATVETTSVAVRVTTVASAVVSTVDLAFATYPTIAALAAGLDTLGHGWSATVWGNFGAWPSSDLRPLQGAATALLGGRSLEMYTEAIEPYAAWPGAGPDAFWDDAYAGGMGWRLDADTGEVFGRFPRGQLNLRVDYQAGFSVIPQAVQEACAQLAQDLYQAGLVNNTLKKATLGPSSVELKTSAATATFSPKVRLLLAPYRDYAKTIFR